MQWSYDEFGILTFSTELWNPEAAAAIVDPAKYQLGARSNDDELKMLRYNDEDLGGAGFIDWQPFDHPQLGALEIGGWTHMYTVRNPPPRSLASTEAARQFLPDMLHSNCLFTLRHAMTAPLLRIRDLEVEALGSGLYKLSALVANQGFLPTHLTQRALAHGTAGEVEVQLDAGEAEIIMGAAQQRVGHLAGRDERTSTWSPWLRQWNDTAARIEWLLRAESGASVSVTASAQKAGAQMRTIRLP